MDSFDIIEFLRADLATRTEEESAKKYGVAPSTIGHWRRARSPSAEACQIALNDYFAFQHEARTLKDKEVVFCIPAYGDIAPPVMLSLFRNMARYGIQKTGLLFRERTMIVDSRNYLADMFLKTESQWCIMVDTDVVLPLGDGALYRSYGAKLPEPMQSQYFIDRIMATNHPLIGGLYFGRHDKGRGQYAECHVQEFENRRVHLMQGVGVRPTQWVAAGAMRVHRSVFEKIKELAPQEFPEIVPRSPQIPWGFFNQIGAGMGEDVSFCLRAAKAGFQPHVDTGCICMHIGRQYYGPTNTSS